MKHFTTMAFRVHVFAIAALIAAPSAYAQNGTWLGNGLPWNDTAAWVGGTIATGSGNTANFTGVNLTSDVSMALGGNRTIGNITFTDGTTSSNNLALTGNTLTLAGTPVINVTQPDRTLTISSILAGTVGFSKTGQGTLTLNGSNTITGASSISAGTLVLDYSTNDNRKLITGGMTLNGGTIVLKGGTTATETFSGTTLGGNNLGTFFMRDSGGSSATLNLNAFTITGTQSVVSFSHDNMATSDRTNVAGIIGSWFTVGNRWAANSSNSTDGNIVGYTGGTAFTPGAATNFDVNYDLAGGATMNGTRQLNTVRIESTANDQILNIGTFALQTSNANGTNALAGTAGGLLYAGGANGNYTINGTGSISGENGNGQSFLFNVSAGNLTVNAFVGAGSSTFIKSGAGTLILNGNNTNLDGSSRILQGTLRARSANALGDDAADSITVQDGAAMELANNIALASKTSLNITGIGVSNGGALRNFANNNSYAGAITIGTGGARINSDTGTLTLTGGVVTAGNTITFGGAGNTTVSTAAISGSGGLVKDGAGITTLSAANTYTGSTTISGGTLSAGSIVVSSNVSGLGNSTSAVTLGSAGAQGTLSYTGNSDTYTRGFTIGGAGGGRLDVTTSGQTLTVDTGAVTGSGLFTVGGAGNTSISANLGHAGGLTKQGAGTLTLVGAKTYSGATSISGGTLALSSNGSFDSSPVITVATGATLDVSSKAGGFSLTSGQSIQGTGTVVGDLLVASGSTLSPGNSPGNLVVTGNSTWAGNATYKWEINDALGVPGNSTAGWDLQTITGNLSITATSGVGDRFIIDIFGLNASNVEGSVVGWSNTGNYTWLIADSGFEVSTFVLDKFTLLTGNFTNNNVATGTFGIARGDAPGITGGDSSQIYLTYVAVPEPATLALAAASVIGLAVAARHRKA